MNRECKDIILRIDSLMIEQPHTAKVWFCKGVDYTKEMPVKETLLPYRYLKHIKNHYKDIGYFVSEQNRCNIHLLTIRQQ